MSAREDRLLRKGQRNLNKKLKLEKQLSNRMRRFFKNQNDLIERLYKDFNIILDANATRDELENILLTHYKRTSLAFAPEIIKDVNRELSANGFEKIDKKHPEITLALLLFIGSEVRNSAEAITATSNKEIVSAISSNTEDADAAIMKLRNRGMVRSQTIGVTETQKASEGTKSTVSNSTNNVIAGSLLGVATLIRVKTWIDRMDKKVRPAHVAARFQSVPVSRPFIVMGEELMFPGDTSLGASIENVANCRCNAVYEFSLI